MRLDRDDLRLSELLYVFDALELIHFDHAIEFAEMLIDNGSYEVDEFFLVPDEFGVDEDIVHGDIVRELDMLFRFIVSEDVPSLGFERSFAHMLLVEHRIIIVVSYHLEKEQSQDQYQKQESEKAEQIEILAHFDISQKCLALQPVLKLLIKTSMMG